MEVVIEWDMSTPTVQSKTKCNCSKGCLFGRCSCFKSCSPCTAMCRCKQCHNPHNRGEHCSKCSPEADSGSDSNVSDDDEGTGTPWRDSHVNSEDIDLDILD